MYHKRKLFKAVCMESMRYALILYNTECTNGGSCARNGICRGDQLLDNDYNDDYTDGYNDDYDDDYDDDYGDIQYYL